MSSVFADSIQEAIDSRDYEVTFVVKVPARNIGEAIRRAVERLPEATATVKDVKEI